MTPNPQQVLSCDTCNHAQKSDAREYPIKCGISKPIPMYVHKYCVSWFGYVGCASHSSRPAPTALDPADAIPFSDWVSQHDATIRKDERNQTLDEVVKLSEMIESNETERWESMGRPKNDGYINGSHSGYGHALRDMRRWIDKIKKAESLRHEAQP